MSEVLVVAEAADGKVSKPTLELLTLARRLGEPVAVLFADGADDVAEALRVAVGDDFYHRLIGTERFGRYPG